MAKRRRIRHRLGRLSPGGVLALMILILLSAVILIPIVFTFLYSFFPKGEIEAYLKTRGSSDATKWLDVLYAPAMYAGAILLGQALVIPLTAYALSRFTFRGRDAIFFCILILMILPFQVTMASSVMMLRWLGLMDTVWAVILPMCFSPFYIFLLRQFMVSIPNELLEAGMVDGVGAVRGFVHVILPVCKPILGAAAALSFADCWNMVEQPLVYLANRQDLRPLSVMFNQISTEGADVAFAGSALYILPTLLIYLYFQEDIVAGIQLSELK